MSLDPQEAATELLKLLKELHHAGVTAGVCSSLCQNILDRTLACSPSLCSLLSTFEEQDEATRDARRNLSGLIWQIVLQLGQACDHLYEFITYPQEGIFCGFLQARSIAGHVRSKQHRIFQLLESIERFFQEQSDAETGLSAENGQHGRPERLTQFATLFRLRLQGLSSPDRTDEQRVRCRARTENERRTPVGQWISMPSGGALYCVATSPNGRRFACVGVGGFAALCDSTASSDPQLRTLVGHSIGVESVAWSPDGSVVATGSWDETARLWSLSGAQLHVLRGHVNGVGSIAWNHRGTRLAAASGDRSVRVWYSRTGVLMHVLTGHVLRVSALAWSPDDKILVTGGFDRTIRLWSSATGRMVRVITWSNSWINSLVWSPTGSTIAAIGSGSRCARIWRANTGEMVRDLKGHTQHLTAIAWSPDGEMIATGSYDHTTIMWDSETGRLVHTLMGHTGSVDSVAWSPDGSALVSCSSDNTARLWSRETGELVHIMKGHTEAIQSVAWSPCARHVFTASSDGTVRIYRLRRATRNA